MLTIRIVAVGKIKETFYKNAIDEYLKRLSRFIKVEIIEVADISDGANSVIREGQSILGHIKGRAVLLDIAGTQYGSLGFAKYINKLALNTSTVTFIIGGSNGVSDEVKAQIDDRISFSAMTFPHQLFRVILLEQLYRAATILNGVSYHK